MAVPVRLIEDVEAVRRQGHLASIEEDGNRFYVILSDFTLPDCYLPNRTNLLMIADYQYPQSALDMFWTEPHISLPSGENPLNADQFEVHLGRTWQRWSWHYQGWNPSTHSVGTHLEVCLDRLAKGQ